MSRIACYLDPERPKADHWMEAFAVGCGGTIINDSRLDPNASDHVVMGNWTTAGNIMAGLPATASHWYLDSSYIQGLPTSYLRIERNRFWPVLEVGAHTMTRAQQMGVTIAPWRSTGRHILVALHGYKFGRPWGIDIEHWHSTIVERIRSVTDRPIVVRPKPNPYAKLKGVPLDAQLQDAWAVVCHSSTVGVKAALAGIPVFCEPTCAAAMVGCMDLSRIEEPVRDEREPWVAELVWRQWSEAEMRSGKAWAHIR